MMMEKILDVTYFKNYQLELTETEAGYFMVRKKTGDLKNSVINLYSNKSYVEAKEFYEKKIGCK